MIVVGGLLSVSESFCAQILNVSLREQVPIIFSEGIPAYFRSVSTILLADIRGNPVILFEYLHQQNSNTNATLIYFKKIHNPKQTKECKRKENASNIDAPRCLHTANDTPLRLCLHAV